MKRPIERQLYVIIPLVAIAFRSESPAVVKYSEGIGCHAPVESEGAGSL